MELKKAFVLTDIETRTPHVVFPAESIEVIVNELGIDVSILSEYPNGRKYAMLNSIPVNTRARYRLPNARRFLLQETVMAVI